MQIHCVYDKYCTISLTSSFVVHIQFGSDVHCFILQELYERLVKSVHLKTLMFSC